MLFIIAWQLNCVQLLVGVIFAMTITTSLTIAWVLSIPLFVQPNSSVGILPFSRVMWPSWGRIWAWGLPKTTASWWGLWLGRTRRFMVWLSAGDTRMTVKNAWIIHSRGLFPARQVEKVGLSTLGVTWDTPQRSSITIILPPPRLEQTQASQSCSGDESSQYFAFFV